jgi:serine/threonine protein kinase
VKRCLTVDPTNRPTSAEILDDDWLRAVGADYQDPGVLTPRGGTMDLLPNVKKAFDAKKTCEWPGASEPPASVCAYPSACVRACACVNQSGKPFWV